MPQLPNRELKKRVKEAGKSLLHPPSSVDELLPVLDRTEVLLAKVEQSPGKSMFTVLSPLMNALVSEKLLKHSDVDVKVGVASCISEITRITAPEAPYDDDKMKDAFRLIVSSFRDISDTSSRSHRKRAVILETVAEFRSCVIMLDLECDQMVIEMFQHFLKAIREHHAGNILSSMEAIMTLIIEESEGIFPDLLDPILSTLKKNNETVQPIAKKLAERVILCCADKLRPYLLHALKTLDARLEDYSEVIASVCGENNGSAAHSNENILTAQSVIESKSASSPVGASLTQVVVKESTEDTYPHDQDLETQISPKSTVANGVDEAGTDETMADTNFLKKADSDNTSDANLVSKAKSGDVGAEEPTKMEAKVNQIAKTKGKQFNPENDSAESSDAHDSSKKQSEQMPCHQENADEDIHSSPTEVPPIEADTSLDNVKDTSVQLSPSEANENEDVNEATPMQSDSLPEKNQLKKSAWTKRKGNKKGTVSISATSKMGENTSGAKKPDKKQTANKTKDGSLIEEDESKNDGESEAEKQKVSDEENIFSGAAKKRLSGKKLLVEKPKKGSASIEEDKLENDGGNGSDSETKSLDQTEKLKGTDEENISGAKKPQKSSPGAKKKKRLVKKQPAKKAKKESTLIEEVESRNDGGDESDSEAESLNLTEKLRDAMKRKVGESQSRKEGGKKSGVKPRPEIDVSETSAREDDREDMVTSPRSPLKSTKDEGIKEETPKMSTKRKRTSGTEKASGASEIGENLVGSKVKVWWPKDRAFYEGVVHSFDSAKHQRMPPKDDKEQTPKNATPPPNLVTSISQNPNQAVDINGYKVKATAAPILKSIFAKYGDITNNCLFKSKSVRASLLEVICDVVQKLQNYYSDTIFLNLETIQNEVADVESAKIDVSWLKQHLAKFHEVSGFHKENLLLKKCKENVGLVVNEVSENLRKRRVEMFLALKRLKEAEKYVDVIKLVGLKIDDEILASENEEYFWRRRLGGLLEPDEGFDMQG